MNAGSKNSTKQLTTQAAKTITPSTSNQTAVASGRYTTGTITVKGDSNLKAENIAKGISIFGVTGTHSGGGGGGSSGGGYLKDMQLENIPNVKFTLIDMSVVSCAFVNGGYIFTTDCSNVTFKDCLFYNSTIYCTQEIRDAIENGEGNSNKDTTWRIL